MITQTYRVDMIPNGAPLVVHVSQYDKDARTLAFDLYNGGVAYTPAVGATANIRGTKPDATVFVYPMSIAGNVVSIALEQQMALVAGDVPCEIQVVDSDGTINSANFILRVEIGAIDESTVPSDTELPIFQQLVQDAQDAADDAEQARDDAQAAQAAAEALIPAGGTTGQFLQKTAGGTAWEDVHEIPTGGTTGQVLAKDTNNNWSVSWHTPYYIPTGGSTGQVLAKNSGSNYDVSWQTASGGGAGNLLITITGSNPPVADQSFTDITANIAAGGTPIVTDGSTMYWLAAQTASAITFVYFIPSGRKRFVIDNTDTVTYDFTRYDGADIAYDNTISGLSANRVQGAIDELAGWKTITKTVTLQDTGWSGSTYTITDTDIPAASDGNVTITMPNAADTTTLTTYITNFKAADLYAFNQVSGAISLYANGTTPSSNMDIVMIIEV